MDILHRKRIILLQWCIFTEHHVGEIPGMMTQAYFLNIPTKLGIRPSTGRNICICNEQSRRERVLVELVTFPMIRDVSE